MAAKEAKKLSMEEMIAEMDAAKKANPLDLSSDQDLSIGLMNLISLEEHFFFSGAQIIRRRWRNLVHFQAFAGSVYAFDGGWNQGTGHRQQGRCV